jgi:shikimate kinase
MMGETYSESGDDRMKESNIVLIGMAGTGKSTVGKLVAAKLGWTFVDTDEAIEREYGVSIATLFAEKGEPAFRLLETEAIRACLAGRKQVVATGGGAVLAEANRKEMLEKGQVVALYAPPEVIIDRVRFDSSRPLFQGNVEERVRALWEQRKHAYDFADSTFDTSDYSAEQIAEQIAERLKNGTGLKA